MRKRTLAENACDKAPHNSLFSHTKILDSQNDPILLEGAWPEGRTARRRGDEVESTTGVFFRLCDSAG